ncbi:PREDICTED: syntaxin-17-like [Priapulus caudatus]|uniref:Syntaxin-17-like n=1 Tax=Priapulus caudatus TaxID=37621 RepID=A0ABM1EWJ7_PRICU|nr:PREDICTED: syntaxin-17-like [Priapulus caudatus]
MRRRLTVTECEPQDVSKQPLRRLEVPLNRFTKVAIPLHLEILEKHKANIHRFAELRQWDRVHREQVNAARTVQQLKSDILEIDLVRCQVRDEDVVEFDRRLEPIKTRAIEAVVELISLQHGDRGYEIPRLSDSALCEESEAENESAASERLQLLEAVEISLEEKRQVLQSWENLKQDLDDLNAMMAELSAAVRQQGEAVDRIEDHVSVADANVEEGTRILAAAAKMKMMRFRLPGPSSGRHPRPDRLLTGSRLPLGGRPQRVRVRCFNKKDMFPPGNPIRCQVNEKMRSVNVVQCCTDTDYCNRGLQPVLSPPTTTQDPDEQASGMNQSLSRWHLTAIISVPICLACFGVCGIVCLYQIYQRNRAPSRQPCAQVRR